MVKKNGIELGDKPILATDFSSVDESMQKWHEKRKKQGQVYHAYSQCILYLEELLECEDDPFEKHLIEKEIKKLRKKRKNYHVPSILEMAIYSDSNEKSKNPLLRLVKKRKNSEDTF